jgi:hypothetical protein
MHRHLAILLLSAVTACAVPPRDLSADAGRAAAKRDITAGHMRIYIAGTEASREVGVESRDRALLASLPRDRSLPIGCTVPHASEAVEFAHAYNREIIRHLRYVKSP